MNNKRPVTAKFDDNDNRAVLRPWAIRFRLGPFATGVIVAVCLWSLWSDVMGLEAYVAWVRDHWAPAWVTAPFYGAMLLAALVARLVDHVATHHVEGDDD